MVLSLSIQSLSHGRKSD
jgi:hypothetical protein